MNILCLGITVADLLAKPVSEMPPKGILEVVDQMGLYVGGCASNAAVDLAQLGFRPVLNALVGEDGLGDYVLKTMAKAGADISAVGRTDRANTSATMVFCREDGERSFFHYSGANGLFDAGCVDEAALDACDILCVAGALLLPSFDGAPMAALLKRAKSMGKITVLDTAWNERSRWLEDIGPCLPYLDHFLPSYGEAARLSGKEEPSEIAAFFRGLGARHVVVKLGEEGCYALGGEGVGTHIPAFTVDAMDTTGAGDAFVAGYVAGLDQGMDLLGCARLGNAVGAFCVVAVGATTGVPSLAEVTAWMGAKN